MYNYISNIMDNSISVNVVIGFFYSAIIGLIILFLTYLLDKKKTLKILSIDLTKSKLALITISDLIKKISSIDGKEYRKFFGDVLDGKEIKEEELKTIKEFILYDEIPLLPKINDYLIEKFNDNVDKKKFVQLIQESDEQKMKFIIKNSSFVVAYEDINRRIISINHKLDYYRQLTFEMIGFGSDDLKTDNIGTKNRFMVFKLCTDSIINDCAMLKSLLDILEKTISKNQIDLERDTKKVERILKWTMAIACITVIISLSLLIIA